MSKQPTGNPPAEVTRVICASVSRVAGSVMHQLLEIRNRVCAPNQTSLVAGALLYSSGWFVLWLEGPPDEVDAALDRAAIDSRNTGQVLIHRSVGAATLDEPLSVAATLGPERATAFGRRVWDIREAVDSGALQEPAEIWQQLGAPCTLSPERVFGQTPDRHIALVAADDNGSIDMLRKLGERFRTPVVYQRFAGPRSHSSDVGAAYIDIHLDNQVSRVQLLARRALAHRMVRRSLAGLDGLVLLPGSHPSTTIELASAVATCLDGLPTRFGVYLLTASHGIARTMGDLLRGASARAVPPEVIAVPEAGLLDLLLGRPPGSAPLAPPAAFGIARGISV